MDATIPPDAVRGLLEVLRWFVNHFQRATTNNIAAFVGDLAPLGVGHVENVDHLIEMRADLGSPDRKIKLEQRTRNSKQQPGAVVAENVDDRITV